MPEGPGVFSLGQIALTAAIGALGSLAAMTLVSRSRGQPAAVSGEMLSLALVVGLSILAWRLAANVPQLNDDPVPLFSPNDLLCPVLTYVFVSVYAGLRPAAAIDAWGATRALLVLVSLAVNVVTI
jgi:hypothetical protein